MSRINLKHLAMTLAVGVMCGGAWAAESGAPAVGAAVILDGRLKDVVGSREKFEEYRDMRNGFSIRDLRLNLDWDTAPYYLDVRIQNALRSDERYSVAGGQHGKFDIALFYDGMPHNFNTGIFMLSGAGTGRLFVDGRVPVALQAVEQTSSERLSGPLGDTTGEDAAAVALVRNALANSGPTTLKLKREKTGVSVSFDPVQDVKAWIKATDEKRTGSRAIGAGTYERWAQGAAGLTHTKDLFLTAGMELAEPIDYRTTTVNTGVGVYKKTWSADAQYSFTNFEDALDRLLWQNPFRNTDLAATNQAETAAAKDFNRGRFVTGQLALPPATESHEFSVSGHADLPMNTRFTGTLAYGLVRHRQTLIPFTNNSALAGAAGGSGPYDITRVSSLPQPEFLGQAHTITQNYALISKPLDGLTATIRYRYYDYRNKSDSITFPGYAAFGESYWRTVKNDDNIKVVNEPPSYRKQTVTAAVDYKVAQPLALNVESFWEGWQRSQLRVNGTYESGAGGGFTYKPCAAANIKGSYRYAHRTVSQYKYGNTPGNPEARDLANYDWADRIRHKFGLRADLEPAQGLSVGVLGQYQNDKYGVDQRFGLKRRENALAGLDATWEPSERVSVFVNYTKEYDKSVMQSGAKDDGFNNAAVAIDDGRWQDNSWNPLNYWNMDIYEKVDTVGLGATVEPIPEKLTLSAGYNFSRSKMDFVGSNPNAADAVAAGYPAGAKLQNGVALPLPSVVSRSHEARADLAYNIVKNVKVGVNYLYERFKLEDFTNASNHLGTNSFENTTKYVFMAANKSSYDAHVAGTYLDWRF